MCVYTYTLCVGWVLWIKRLETYVESSQAFSLWNITMGVHDCYPIMFCNEVFPFLWVPICRASEQAAGSRPRTGPLYVSISLSLSLSLSISLSGNVFSADFFLKKRDCLLDARLHDCVYIWFNCALIFMYLPCMYPPDRSSGCFSTWMTVCWCLLLYAVCLIVAMGNCSTG